MKNKLSVAIITYNEERMIKRCLESVKWADEIIVVDSGSTDMTVKTAKKYGAKVVNKKWMGFSKQKNFALSLAKNKWILSLDGDELVSPELAREIRETIVKQGAFYVYRIPRKNFYYGGRWLKHGSIYPDAAIRLIQKNRGAFRDVLVHEEIDSDSPAGILKHDIEHYSKPGIGDHINALSRYTTLDAQEAYSTGRRATGYSVLVKPLFFFIKRYIFKAGFLDGFEGFLYHIMSAWYLFIYELKLLELERPLSGYKPWGSIFKRSLRVKKQH